MKIPQVFIDDLLARINLIDIIEPRIALKKTGKANYSGLCPFHQEKSPSFTVNQAKQFYHCFGCKASGNAIGFLMAYEKLSFLEAIEMLAAKAGISLPQTSYQKTDEKKPSPTILEECAHFYEQALKRSSPAQAYLKQRGLDLTVIQRFKLGYAPIGWDNLQKRFPSEKESALLETGMLIQKEDNGTYDRFRDRIMFPIRNRRGQTIAFGGRSVKSAQPKYLNSPDSPLFHKSRELYGLFETLETTKRLENFIIVEGYLDVIALHQHGLTQAVATLGTAISTTHIQTLVRFSENLFFCFDGDEAGKTAAWRALQIALPLMHTGMNVKFLFLPNQEDPDSYIRKTGSAEFKKQLLSAMPLTEFFIQKLANDTEIESLAGKTRFIHLTDKHLHDLPKGIFRELIMQQVAKIVGLSNEKIQAILNPAPDNQTIRPKNRVSSQKIAPPTRLAISLLLQAPTLLNKTKVPDDFHEIPLNGISILHKLVKIISKNKGYTTGSLLEYLKEEEEFSLVCELAAQDLLIPEETWQRELQDAFNWIGSKKVEMAIQILLTKGKNEGLNPEEKKQLQNLLILQKQL